VNRAIDVPLREVSGICLRRGRKGQMSLIAVGDRVAKVAWLSLPPSDSGPLDWSTTSVAKVSGSKLPKNDPQSEAVCTDGAGRVLFLQESPPRVELVDFEDSRVVASISLSVPGRSQLARSWSDPKGSRGEGVVLLRGGHLLVAKEKDPAALIEFGPAGAKSRGLIQGGTLAGGARWPIADGEHRFVALATWWPDKALDKSCADYSDLEIGPDGRLYLLSDKSAVIARLDDLTPGGGTATLTASWKLDDLDGKPEGLAFAADGRAVVALDTPKRRNNLVLLEPPIAASPIRTKSNRATKGPAIRSSARRSK
jgi:hypothetical protein